MDAVIPIIRELTATGDSMMWIVGPGDMVSENYSRGIEEPRVHGRYVTVRAHNWLFHLEPEIVARIEFVETFGDLVSFYVRFADADGQTLLRAYLPRRHDGEDETTGGNNSFEDMKGRYAGADGVEYVRREVRSSRGG